MLQGKAFELLWRIHSSNPDIFSKATQVSLQFTRYKEVEIILHLRLDANQSVELRNIVVNEGLELSQVSGDVWIIR